MTDPTSPVEAYLDRLRARLGAGRAPADRGPVDELVDEIRDHLLTEVEGQRERGVADGEAWRHAVEVLGPADRLADALHDELVRPRLRRLGARVVLVAFGGAAVWTAVLGGPSEPWTDRTEPRPIAVLDVTGAVAGLATLLTALLGLLLVVGPGRRPDLPESLRAAAQRWSPRLCGISVALGAGTALQMGGYLVIRSAVAPHSVAWPMITSAALVSAASLVVLVRPARAVATMPRRDLAGRRP